ncbi:unnamed protein product, partial [Phaeothamnion confervicola]
MEKANAILNRLVAAGRAAELCIVVIDELHMIADAGRGPLLELLLTKLLHLSRRRRRPAGSSPTSLLALTPLGAASPCGAVAGAVATAATAAGAANVAIAAAPAAAAAAMARASAAGSAGNPELSASAAARSGGKAGTVGPPAGIGGGDSEVVAASVAAAGAGGVPRIANPYACQGQPLRSILANPMVLQLPPSELLLPPLRHTTLNLPEALRPQAPSPPTSTDSNGPSSEAPSQSSPIPPPLPLRPENPYNRPVWTAVAAARPRPARGISLPPQPTRAEAAAAALAAAAAAGSDASTGMLDLQVVGLSATLPNMEEVADWMGAILYTSEFRPVPLTERVLRNGTELLDRKEKLVRTLLIDGVGYGSGGGEPAAQGKRARRPDPGLLAAQGLAVLCRESVAAANQVIIFCSTRQHCLNCALAVAKALALCPPPDDMVEQRAALLTRLAAAVPAGAGADPGLRQTVPAGVAFHHAGLAEQERTEIEAAYRGGLLSVLAATSTLGAGVNLPAARVIFRSLDGGGGRLTVARYRQMAGRAGRAGGSAHGEAILMVVTAAEYRAALALMNASLPRMVSGMSPLPPARGGDGGAALLRAVLEGVAGGMLTRRLEVRDFIANTLLWRQFRGTPAETAAFCTTAATAAAVGGGDDGGDAVKSQELLVRYAEAALDYLLQRGCVSLYHARPADYEPDAVAPATPPVGSGPVGAAAPTDGPAANTATKE